MNSGRNIEHPPSISLVDIYFVVFRRKWLILTCAFLGVAAATAYYFLRQPVYQSSAKLMIKYITETRPVINPGENGSQTTSTTDPNASMMNSELQILSSFDIYQEVATNIGPDKILGKGSIGGDAVQAAAVIGAGVKVEPSRDSTVILITFSHP